MFITNNVSNISYGGKYVVDSYSVVYNSVCAGGQLFFGKDRHICIDIDEETGQCYGISIILDAFDFYETNYELKEFKTAKLFYKDPSLTNYLFCTCKDLLFKCYVNTKKGLILIGNPNSLVEPIRFFDDTFVSIKDDQIELLIIKVGEDIIQKIKRINTPCCTKKALK